MKDFLSTIYGKLIAVLTIIALVMGIGIEGISIKTAYYNMRKARCDASISATTAQTNVMSGYGRASGIVGFNDNPKLMNIFARDTKQQYAFLDDCLSGEENSKE